MSRLPARKINGAKVKQYTWIYLFILPSFVIFLMFYLVPIVTVFFSSFTDWDGFNSPNFVGFDNYLRLFRASSFQESLFNLIGWSIIAATLHVGFGALVAFVLYRKPFGWRFTQTVFMIPNVISVAAWSMIYKYFFRDDIGMLNTILRNFKPDLHINWFFEEPYAFWAITLTWLFYAVVVTLLVMGDLMAIPDSIHEAARIDGASTWQSVWKIDLPLCRNAIGTGVICSITARIAMYESIYLTTNGAGGTMNFPMILVRAVQDSEYGYANVSAVMMIIIGLITLAIVNRAFRMNESVY